MNMKANIISIIYAKLIKNKHPLFWILGINLLPISKRTSGYNSLSFSTTLSVWIRASCKKKQILLILFHFPANMRVFWRWVSFLIKTKQSYTHPDKDKNLIKPITTTATPNQTHTPSFVSATLALLSDDGEK